MDNSGKESSAVTHTGDELHQDPDVAVQLAYDVTNTVYSPWSPTMWRLYAVITVAYLGGCLNGYDGSLMGGLNAMKSYQEYFDM